MYVLRPMTTTLLPWFRLGTVLIFPQRKCYFSNMIISRLSWMSRKSGLQCWFLWRVGIVAPTKYCPCSSTVYVDCQIILHSFFQPLALIWWAFVFVISTIGVIYHFETRLYTRLTAYYVDSSDLPFPISTAVSLLLQIWFTTVFWRCFRHLRTER